MTFCCGKCKEKFHYSDEVQTFDSNDIVTEDPDLIVTTICNECDEKINS